MEKALHERKNGFSKKQGMELYMKNRKERGMLWIPLIMSVVLFGGFYSFSAYFIGVMVLLLLFIQLGRNKKSRTAKNEIFYGSILLCVTAVISAIAGVNKGMAWLGVLRVMVIAIWIFYLMQFSKEERQEALSVLPLTGGIMVMAGVISFCLKPILPGVTALFWQAGRFGGTFQYSNTCALFLLIGLLLLSEQEKIEKKELILFDFLLSGIFLTGSKGGVLLLIPVLAWILIKKSAFRKNGIVMVVLLVVGSIVYAMLSGDFQNIGRIYTLLKYPSTLLGRFLYMKDALPILVENPLGIGYMGYAGIQSSIQTGVYTSMFVHNDWMQMGLDFGWVFLLVTVGIIIYQLIKGKQDKTKKIILCLICFYSLLEFHLQYLSIVMIMILLFDFRENTIIENKRIVARENQIFSLAGLLLLGYFGIASLFTYMGNYEKALSMYPYDTQALEAVLREETDKDAAVLQAKEILEISPYSSTSYNVLAYGALMDGDNSKALEYKIKVLELEKYNITEYADFKSITDTIQSMDSGSYAKEICEKGLEEMEQLLKNTEENTSSIAYKLRDKPVFTWGSKDVN